ncbi:aldehyde dehydrogenase family protein [Pelagibius sp.]|uniref:aldehyde dehydrogenase family protein n=1 Tax=Pelagibius sp. TaxID=1931238 RepID=UPI003BB0883B
MNISVNPLVTKHSNLNSALRMTIGGAQVDARDGSTMPVIDPSTGRQVATIPEGKAADADRAVKAARERFQSPEWRKMKPVARQRLLLKFADLIEAHADELAELESIDAGKPLAIARNSDLASVIDVFRYFAGWATKLTGETLDVSVPRMPDGEFFAYTKKEPVGVVVGITPWNFPISMASWKLAPALAAGCTVILKPAEDTSLTALRLGELALEAGYPDGAVNIVTGRGHEIGAALVAHPGVDKVSFTGSVATGQAIGRSALDKMTRTTLELGGKSPVIVMPDANLDWAVTGAAMAIFFNQGQTCTAGSRLYVHRTIYDEFVERVVEAAKQLKIGPAFEDGVFFGPVISEAHAEKVMSYVDTGRSEGVHLTLTGERLDRPGYFLSPTVMTGTRESMRVVQEEIFGPVLAAAPFDTEEEAIELANGTPFGLAASIWTENLSAAHQLAAQVQSGIVWVNCHNLFDPNLPFGGVKLSGLGKDLGRSAVESCLEQKSVMIRLQ